MTRWPELRLNVARLRKHPSPTDTSRTGGAAPVDVAVTVAADAIAMSTAHVPDGSPIDVVGTVVSARDGLEFRGIVRAGWAGDCRRCLEPVVGAIETTLSVAFVSDDAELEADDADTYPIDGDWIDLGEPVFEELMLALPLSPLCDDACAGADPERFPATMAGSVEETEPEPDPRWEALSDIDFDEE